MKCARCERGAVVPLCAYCFDNKADEGMLEERGRIVAGIRKRVERLGTRGWPANGSRDAIVARALERLADDLEGLNGRSLESEP